MKIFIIIWLLLGFIISFGAVVLSRGKKIKPKPLDTLLTVFLWPFFLFEVLLWKITMTKEEKDYLQKLIDEDE